MLQKGRKTEQVLTRAWTGHKWNNIYCKLPQMIKVNINMYYEWNQLWKTNQQYFTSYLCGWVWPWGHFVWCLRQKGEQPTSSIPVMVSLDGIVASSSPLCCHNYSQTCSAESRLHSGSDSQSPLSSWRVEWSSPVCTQSLTAILKGAKEKRQAREEHL